MVVYVLDDLEKLVKRKLAGFKIPEEITKEVNKNFKDRIELIEKKKASDTFKLTPFDITQHEHALHLKYFLDKENLDGCELPKEIHAAGLLKKGLLIEPISKNLFVYNWCGLKGLAKVELYPDTKKYYLEIEETEILLKGKPIQNFSFKLPDVKAIKRWINNREKITTKEQLFKEIKYYFKLFMDLPEEAYYDLLTLFVFQTWISEILYTVFYLVIFGQWGGGKTTLGELVTNLSKHGYAVGNPSVALIGRLLENQKVMMFIDELDSLQIKSTEDSDLYAIIRQGYRKGLKYSRINKNTMEEEIFNVFGPKIFTIHKGIEEALQTRSIPITTSETQDKRLPIINLFKEKYAEKLFNKLFMWYIDNILILIDNIDDDIDDIDVHKLVSSNNNIYRPEEVERGRDTLSPAGEVINIISNIKSKSKDYTGRNAELRYIMKIIEMTLQVNLSKSIDKVFETKKEIEEERLEIGYSGLLREFLVKLYHENKDKPDHVTKEGELKIANKEMYEGFNRWLKNSDRGGVAPATFQGYLREFSFERPISRRRLRYRLINEAEGQVRLCNVYIPAVMKRIGLKPECLIPEAEEEEIEGGK